jgi:hypothetical protein
MYDQWPWKDTEAEGRKNGTEFCRHRERVTGCDGQRAETKVCWISAVFKHNGQAARSNECSLGEDG